MGRHAAERTATTSRRRFRPRRAVSVAGVVALTAAVVGAGITLNDDPPTTPTAARAITASSPTVAPVVSGARFNTRIYRFSELDRKYARLNLTRVSGDPQKPTTFAMGTFNILGSSWTAGRKTWSSGAARAARAGSLARARGLTVIGLQEVQKDQVAPFASASGMRVFPGNGSGMTPANSLAWDEGIWEAVKTETISIPYYAGMRVPSPHVLLRHRGTGVMVWFGNYHNASDMLGNAQGTRNADIAMESALMRDLTDDGTPMIQTGDMNERLSYFCRMNDQVGGGLQSADGSTGSGGCRAGQRITWIDWIVGKHVTFSDYVMDMGTRSQRISDHPIVTATVTVPAAADNGECRSYKRHGRTAWWCPDPLSAG